VTSLGVVADGVVVQHERQRGRLHDETVKYWPMEDSATS